MEKKLDAVFAVKYQAREELLMLPTEVRMEYIFGNLIESKNTFEKNLLDMEELESLGDTIIDLSNRLSKKIIEGDTIFECYEEGYQYVKLFTPIQTQQFVNNLECFDKQDYLKLFDELELYSICEFDKLWSVLLKLKYICELAIKQHGCVLYSVN